MTNLPELKIAHINGHRVLLRPVRHNDIFALGIFSPWGAANDPREKSGLGSLKQSVMMKGAGERDAFELAQAIEDLGSNLGGSTSRDFSKFGLSASTEALEPTLDLLHDILHAPHFAEDELERERRLQIADLRSRDDNQFYFTSRHLLRLLYPDHSYGDPSDGTLETLPAIVRDDLPSTHRAHLRTQGSVVAGVGNFDETRLLERLRDILPQLELPRDGAAVPEPESLTDKPHHQELSKVCEQAFLCAGWRTVPMKHPDYPALRVLSALMGEGMGSRMFVRLRDELGLAYATGCALYAGREMSHIVMYIGTNPDRIEESRAGFDRLIDQIRQEAPSRDELDRARNYVTGRFLFDHQKNSRQAHYLGFFEMMGLGYQADADYPELIRSVTPQDVLRAAQRYLHDPVTALLLPEPAGKEAQAAAP